MYLPFSGKCKHVCSIQVACLIEVTTNIMYFKKIILQKVMFAKSYCTINVCIFSSYIRASFMQINIVRVQLASCCCLNTIHNN